MSWFELEDGGLLNLNNGSEYVFNKITGGARLWSAEADGFVRNLSPEEFKQIKRFLLNKEEAELRDKFARAALSGILSSSHPSYEPPLNEGSDSIAKYAYNYADSMMKECDKKFAKFVGESAQPKWQPIETAPKDTAVICCNELGHVGEACFISGIDNPAWYWASDPQQIPLSLLPTHWMPLPEPPKERDK